MDDRRPNTFHQTRARKSDREISSATIGTMLFSTILGCLLLFTFGISGILVTQLTLFFSTYIFLLASTLISDFTSVLIDIRDNFIILPKPVTDKTFVLSRLLHILIHVTKIIVPMSIPGTMYMTQHYGLAAAFVFFLMILLATMFTVFLINIVYLVILKISSPQKFQGIISYVQISLIILVYAGFQLMPNFVINVDPGRYDVSSGFWIWLLPAYWFARGFEFFTLFSLQPSMIAGALLSTLVSPFSLWLVITYFAPSFNQKLSLVTGTTEEAGTIKKARRDRTFFKFALAESLAKLVARKGAERMGFLITWKLMGRLRDFKLKVYPSLGYLLIILVPMFLKNNFSLHELQSQQGYTRTFIVSLMYASSLVAIMALGQLPYSENFKAAWFYFTMPIKEPGLIFSGAFKAVVVKVYLPLVLIVSIFEIILIGFNLIPNILLGLSNVFLSCLVLSIISSRTFPFSTSQEMSQKAGAMFRGLISTVIILIVGLLHYLIYNMRAVVIITLLLSAIGNWLLLNYIKRKSWAQVLESYDE